MLRRAARRRQDDLRLPRAPGCTPIASAALWRTEDHLWVCGACLRVNLPSGGVHALAVSFLPLLAMLLLLLLRACLLLTTVSLRLCSLVLHRLLRAPVVRSWRRTALLCRALLLMRGAWVPLLRCQIRRPRLAVIHWLRLHRASLELRTRLVLGLCIMQSRTRARRHHLLLLPILLLLLKWHAAAHGMLLLPSLGRLGLLVWCLLLLMLLRLLLLRLLLLRLLLLLLLLPSRNTLGTLIRCHLRLPRDSTCLCRDGATCRRVAKLLRRMALQATLRCHLLPTLHMMLRPPVPTWHRLSHVLVCTLLREALRGLPRCCLSWHLPLLRHVLLCPLLHECLHRLSIPLHLHWCCLRCSLHLLTQTLPTRPCRCLHLRRSMAPRLCHVLLLYHSLRRPWLRQMLHRLRQMLQLHPPLHRPLHRLRHLLQRHPSLRWRLHWHVLMLCTRLRRRLHRLCHLLHVLPPLLLVFMLHSL